MAVTKVGHFQAGNKEILSGLRQLGFTDYEARIYIQLLKASPATAYEVSKAAGVPRANTYAALEALAQRGAVLPVNEEPLRYVAAPPKSLFEGISRQTRALCSDLSNRLLAMTSADQDYYVWTTHGEMAVQEQIEAIIAESRHSIWIKAAGRRDPAPQGVAAKSGRAGRRDNDRPVRQGRRRIPLQQGLPGLHPRGRRQHVWEPPIISSPSRSISKRC